MRLKVKVVPRARRERIQEKEGAIWVYLTTPPIKGRANQRLIEMLSEYFSVKKYNIRILKGEHSQQKVVEIIEGD